MTQAPNAMRKTAKLWIATLATAVLFSIAIWQAGGAMLHPLVAAQLILSDPQALSVPVAGIRATQLTNSWGSPRSGGRHHQGIDIFAPRGREVVSSTRGIIVTVGINSLGGRVVRVLGPGGEWHYYAHLEHFGAVRAGQIISRGTVLGYVGDSGNARGTPTHLHYGIYRFRGGALNPYPLFVSRHHHSI